MNPIFEIMDCNNIEKKCLEDFQLTYSATKWWEAVKATIGKDATSIISWPTFKTRFLEKYFPESEKDKRDQEFIKLVQENIIVQEHTL